MMKQNHMVAFGMAICLCLMIAGPATALQNKSKAPTLGEAVERSVENGVRVWRVKPQPVAINVPELLGKAPAATKTKVIVKEKIVVVPRTRPARIRVIGHFSGYGKRIPFVQGFYSGYPRSKNSRDYVQGFYSGYKTNRKRRFPLERPNGYRRVGR